MTEKQRQYQATMVSLMMKHEKIFSNRVKPMLNSQFLDVARYIDNGNVRDADLVVDRQTLRWEGLWDSEYSRIATDISAFGLPYYENKLLKEESSDDFNQVEWDAMDTFWRLFTFWAVKEGIKTVRRIFTTTKKIISRIVIKGLQEGLTNTDIAKQIRSTGRVSSKARANTIARTETHKVAEETQRNIVRSLKVPTEKQWLDAGDERVRTWHRNVMGNAWIDFDDYFIVKGERMLYPGDSNASAENTANCRCSVDYRRKGI